MLGVVVANYATTQPFGTFGPPTTQEIFSALVLLFVTGLLGATFDRLRRSRAEAVHTAVHLAVASEQLKEQAAELEHQLEESQVMAEELEQANEQLGVLSGYNERARTQLEQAVERYRALVEASTVVVWTADPLGAIADMPAWRELTGQSPQEVRGLGWIEAVHPAERETVRARWAASISSGDCLRGGVPASAPRRRAPLVPRARRADPARWAHRRVGRRVRRHTRGARGCGAPRRGRERAQRARLVARLPVDPRGAHATDGPRARRLLQRRPRRARWQPSTRVHLARRSGQGDAAARDVGALSLQADRPRRRPRGGSHRRRAAVDGDRSGDRGRRSRATPTMPR